MPPRDLSRNLRGSGLVFRLDFCRLASPFIGFSALRPAFCCNNLIVCAVTAMGVAIYLALVGGGLTAAYLSAVILKGVKLI